MNCDMIMKRLKQEEDCMKQSKRLIALLLATLSVGSMAACGQENQTEDKRPSIYLSLFNGGYGRVWLDQIVNDYNAAHPENEYKITVRASKDEFNTIYNQLTAGTAVYDMAFTNAYAYKMIDANLLEDISSVWDSKPEGSDKTVRQMMIDSENYAEAYKGDNGGLYALPWYESVRSFVYDHELFLQYGLLFGQDGNLITDPAQPLSVGKDGVAGTYDDGHPETEAQWELMSTMATNMLGYAFNYSGKFSVYLNEIFHMISAQYDGVDKFMLNYTFDGTYDFGDGNGETEITLENGYRVTEMKGKKVALEFMDKYLACKDTMLGITNKYTYPNASTLSYSHTDAQSDFIVFTARNKTEKIGMLVEGDWWENESKMVFKDLAEIGYTDYDFRKHEYRFMTLPRFNNQKEEGNVYVVPDNNYLVLKKQTNATKRDICKDFMTHALQPKYVQNFTVEAGGVMPYDVELTTEQKAKLSPFTKNFLELYRDRENNKFINIQQLQNRSMTQRGGLAVGTSNGEHYVVINGLYYYSAADYISKWTNYYTQDDYKNWNTNKAAYLDYLSKKGLTHGEN